MIDWAELRAIGKEIDQKIQTQQGLTAQDYELLLRRGRQAVPELKDRFLLEFIHNQAP